MQITNKNIRNYKILRTYTAGIILTGPEVKSVKKGSVELKGSYASLKKQKEKLLLPAIYLLNCKIAPYLPAKSVQIDYNPESARVLLLQKKEISYLVGQLQNKGLSLIPLKIFIKNNLIKVELALVRGLKKIDKREKIKKREIEREMRKRFKYNLR